MKGNELTGLHRPSSSAGSIQDFGEYIETPLSLTTVSGPFGLADGSLAKKLACLKIPIVMPKGTVVHSDEDQ